MARRQSARYDLDDDDVDEAPRAQRPRRRRRLPWRLLLVLLAIVAAAIAAPTIIGKTPLRNYVLGEALPPPAGLLAAADGSFAWLGNQTLAGFSLREPSGQPLVTAESVRLERSLFGLATNSSNLGKLVLVRPTVYLDTHDGGSNLEDFVQRLTDELANRDPDDVASSQPVVVEIEIVDGVVVNRDATSGQQWHIAGINATAKPIAGGAQWDVAGEGVVAPTAGPPGEAPTATPVALSPTATDLAGKFKFRLHPGAEGRQQLELLADRLPLGPIEPWLARALPGARLNGTASADVKAAWTVRSKSQNDQSKQSAASQIELLAIGKVDAAGVRFTAPALNGDLVELPTASINVDAKLDGDRLSAAQLAATTEWAAAEFHGELDVAALRDASLASLPRTDASLSGHVDLAQLTRMLPRTLRLREGVTIDAGRLEFNAQSATNNKTNSGPPASRGVPAPGEPSPNSHTWTIAVAAENLAGSDGTRPIRWSQPVEARLAAADGPGGPHLVEAGVTAPFASATAQAVDEGFHGQVAFNLANLATELGQFVDLSAWQLAGTGEGDFTLRHTGPEGFVVTAELDLKGVDVRRGGQTVWVDPQLRLEMQASGERDGATPRRFNTATAFMRGPRDQLALELLEPIELAAPQREWLVKINGAGPLDSWAGRLRPWVAAVPAELSGQATVSAEVRAGEGVVQVVESNLGVEDLRTTIGASPIIEPRLEASGDFRWDAASRTVESRDLKIASSTLAATIRGLSLVWSDSGPPTVRGNIAFRGDFERLAAWLGMAGVEGALVPRGEGTGRLALASDARRATATLTMSAAPLQLVRRTGGVDAVAWNEPRVELSTQAAYTTADDRLELNNLQLQGQTVQLAGAGVVERLKTAGLARCEANLTYDSTQLAQLLASYLGPDVQLRGANQLRLQAAGALRSASPPPPSSSSLQPPASSLPHWSRRWEVTAEAGWAAANIYGLPIGAAQLTANVRDGQATFSPLDLPVGQGRISLQPRATLDPPPQVLHLPGGQMISNVAVSAEVSQRALKYAAPILAGATRAEGTFSFFLEGAQIPLRHPKQGRAGGRLTIHQLSIAPGPMIQDVARIVRQLGALSKQGQGGLGLLDAVAPSAGDPLKGITMNQQTIEVQVVDGRVYHRNLEFLIDDVVVKSQGSVGFDETIALVLQVPIQQKWVGSRPALQGLVGQVLEIPINGTFNQPKVEGQAVGNFLAQAAQAAAGGLLGDELNKALDKLFKPR
jgi:translocation and assembly module TamB